MANDAENAYFVFNEKLVKMNYDAFLTTIFQKFISFY